MAPAGTTPRGRPRDEALDCAIKQAALDVLAESGLEGMSFAAVARRAGTSRPAIYRRYTDLTSLAVDALASLARTTAPQRTGDHLHDLTAELASFRDGITRANGIGLTAAVLGGATDPAIKRAYRSAVVEPRRRRIADILAAAARDGLVVADDETRQLLTTMCVGSWYAYAVAGITAPPDWPRRTAELVLGQGPSDRPSTDECGGR